MPETLDRNTLDQALKEQRAVPLSDLAAMIRKENTGQDLSAFDDRALVRNWRDQIAKNQPQYLNLQVDVPAPPPENGSGAWLTTPLAAGLKPYMPGVAAASRALYGDAKAGFFQGFGEMGIDMTSPANLALLAGSFAKLPASVIAKAPKLFRLGKMAVTGSLTVGAFSDLAGEVPEAWQALKRGDEFEAGRHLARTLGDLLIAVPATKRGIEAARSKRPVAPTAAASTATAEAAAPKTEPVTPSARLEARKSRLSDTAVKAQQILSDNEAKLDKLRTQEKPPDDREVGKLAAEIKRQRKHVAALQTELKAVSTQLEPERAARRGAVGRREEVAPPPLRGLLPAPTEARSARTGVRYGPPPPFDVPRARGVILPPEVREPPLVRGRFGPPAGAPHIPPTPERVPRLITGRFAPAPEIRREVSLPPFEPVRARGTLLPPEVRPKPFVSGRFGVPRARPTTPSEPPPAPKKKGAKPTTRLSVNVAPPEARRTTTTGLSPEPGFWADSPQGPVVILSMPGKPRGVTQPVVLVEHLETGESFNVPVSELRNVRTREGQ